MRIKNNLLYIIKNSLPVIVDDNDINIKENYNGYYSTDIALFLSDKVNRNSIEIANDIRNKISSDFISNISVLDSGIINIYVNRKFLIKSVKRILEEKKNFGKNNFGNGKKVNIGYINLFSNRSFGIDIANLVAYGDSLSRVMSYSGYDVTRECYIENEDYSIEKVKIDLDKYRVNFDIFIDKELLINNGILDSALMSLQKSGKCYIKDNSLWLKVSDLYGNSDIILVKEDGSYTEIFCDIAYHINRFNKKFDKIIDICLENSDNYVNIIKAALVFSGCDINIYEIKKVNGFNLEDKMEFMECNTIDEIISKFGINELRYFFSNKCDDHLTYEKFKFSTESVHYIDNINFIVCSILKKNDYESEDVFGTMNDIAAYTILNKMIEFEENIILASEGNVDIIGKYLYDLSCLFEKYFNDKIISGKLFLVEAIHICMNNAANMIGLILREEK